MINHFYKKIDGWFTFPGLYSKLVERCELGGHIVEVGSWKGKSAAYMVVEVINSNKNITFTQVDTWNGSEEHLTPSSPFYEPLLLMEDGLYNTFMSNLSSVSEYINPIRLSSVEASKMFPDKSLDSVFLDAAHDYDNVILDINAWLPKIKNGGLLCGHDYAHAPVKMAVDELLPDAVNIPNEDVWIFRV